jgi:hypothetical protein
VSGQLFSDDFLREGIKTSQAWPELAEEDTNSFLAQPTEIYAALDARSRLNEAVTEQEIILRVLSALGWGELRLPQNTASGARREDVPDWLLFPDQPAKSVALKEKREDRRYRHGVAILEAKRWLRALDRGDAADRLDPGTPSNQILRYLSAAEVASDCRIRWGILTNGAI